MVLMKERIFGSETQIGWTIGGDVVMLTPCVEKSSEKGLKYWRFPQLRNSKEGGIND